MPEPNLISPASAFNPNDGLFNGHHSPATADSTSTWEQPRGAMTLPDGRIGIGRVGAPGPQEATSDTFYFWIPPDALVEKTQLVTCHSRVGGHDITFYAVVNEVHRTSRGRTMGGEMDHFDGDLSYEPPFASEGCTYAEAAILRTEPPYLTPPRERSVVVLAGQEDAYYAYRADEIDKPKQLPVGLIVNGGMGTAGPGYIDLDYLLGANGGHMNVNGAAGRGTKSSFLLWINWLLLNKARQEAINAPSARNRLRIVPIILNVKNFDLFHIDKASRRFNAEKHLAAWQEIGIDEPVPFKSVNYYAPQALRGEVAIPDTGRGDVVKPYSWSLRDIVSEGLFPYLFSEDDVHEHVFAALLLDIENHLTTEKANNDGSMRRELRTGTVEHHAPQNFQELLQWTEEAGGGALGNRHNDGTWKRLHRRLLRIIYAGKGILRRHDYKGKPLQVVRQDNSDPIVVDLNGLAGETELQRFVVAAILKQIVDARTGTNAVPGLKYVVTLDELNRFAPRGSRDPVTKLIETVAAEMRSQGVILLGAQQQASKVSEKVIENAAIRVIGKSGPLELTTPAWRMLSDGARVKAENLGLDEKLVLQDNFREPMHVRVPFPAWALNPEEATTSRAMETNGAVAPAEDDLMDLLGG